MANGAAKAQQVRRKAFATGFPGSGFSTAGRFPASSPCIAHVRQALSISERRACAALGQHRSTQRKVPRGREDEEKLTDDLVALAREPVGERIHRELQRLHP